MMNGGPVHQKSYKYKAQMKELGVTLGESSVMTSIVHAEYVCLSNGAKECMAYSELVDFFRDADKGNVQYSKAEDHHKSADMTRGRTRAVNIADTCCLVFQKGFRAPILAQRSTVISTI